MGETINLSGDEAINKIREIAKSADICLFTTALSQLPLSTRPMSTQEIDEEGSLWFLSGQSSHKNHDIESDPRVQLFYYNKSNSEYLSVYGEADIYKDRQHVEEHWTPIAKAWFTEGKDDPDLTIIRVRPLNAYYWDTKHNKMIAVMKIAVSAITGKTMDDGVEGEIRINQSPV